MYRKRVRTSRPAFDPSIVSLNRDGVRFSRPSVCKCFSSPTGGTPIYMAYHSVHSFRHGNPTRLRSGSRLNSEALMADGVDHGGPHATRRHAKSKNCGSE